MFSFIYKLALAMLSPLTTMSSHFFSPILTLLFSILFLLLPWAHPISFNISRFDPGATNILYEGDAKPTVGAIELNLVNYLSRVSRATFSERVRLWDSSTGELSEFTTHFSFTIDTRNVSIYGSGLAFFLAPVGFPIPPNSPGGFLGLFNTTTSDATSENQIVMVEFDTYVSEEWDPPVQHVGINNNSISSAVYASWDAGLHSDEIANAWVTYNATTKNLSVFLTYEKDPVFLGNSTLFYNIDLMKVLPEWVTVGFSAATSQYVERHIINSWEFNSSLDSKETQRKNPRKSIWIVVAATVFLVLMISICVGVWLVVQKKRRIREAADNRNGKSVNGYIERDALPKRFSYKELALATNNFAIDRKLGEGGSGRVYKGFLNDLGRLVAVKKITISQNAEQLFITELKIISGLIYQNLVPFIGWCHDQGEFLLVYEYMYNGSLDTHLFFNRTPLPWKVRYKIALGLASALLYLHEESGKCVLHRDIKSANVMLDTDFNARLGDFGVSKLVDPQLGPHTTGVVGTFGYLAPEYYHQRRASTESDIFSFGVVALEIACGRKKDRDEESHKGLVEWVWDLYGAGKVLDAADERLNDDVNTREMECLMIVGLWCAHPVDNKRPSARRAIQFLKFEEELLDLPHEMPIPEYLAPPPPVNSIQPSITNSLSVGR
ncbi:hypothetical protein HHK36_017780 [Tetracentron sinense]|uniref:Protein kinase domain-containing protein n=1 Tax=Tetracentron sinense TaxID=13715 RepID=A0A835DCX0_TETSI|nr:hypothetical protein HHK36_017780 [Tetracentron sinense]